MHTHIHKAYIHKCIQTRANEYKRRSLHIHRGLHAYTNIHITYQGCNRGGWPGLLGFFENLRFWPKWGVFGCFYCIFNVFKAISIILCLKIMVFLKKSTIFQKFWRLRRQNLGFFHFSSPKNWDFSQKVTPPLGRSPPPDAPLKYEIMSVIHRCIHLQIVWKRLLTKPMVAVL